MMRLEVLGFALACRFRLRWQCDMSTMAERDQTSIRQHNSARPTARFRIGLGSLRL